MKKEEGDWRTVAVRERREEEEEKAASKRVLLSFRSDRVLKPGK